MTLWPRSCLHSKSRFHNRSDPRKSREEPCWKCRRVTVVTVTSCWRHLSCWQTQGPTKIYQSCKLMNVDKSGNTNSCHVIHRNTLKSERSLCWQGSWIESNCSGCHPLFQQPFVDLQLAHPGCYGFQQQPAAARKNKITGAAIVSPLGLKIETPMGWHEELNLDAKTASCLKSPWCLHPPKKWHGILKKMPFERGSSLAKIFFQGLFETRDATIYKNRNVNYQMWALDGHSCTKQTTRLVILSLEIRRFSFFWFWV